jgi:hypothetical protein
VISTGHTREDFHVHIITMHDVRLEQIVSTQVEDGHSHRLHID